MGLTEGSIVVVVLVVPLLWSSVSGLSIPPRSLNRSRIVSLGEIFISWIVRCCDRHRFLWRSRIEWGGNLMFSLVDIIVISSAVV